MTQQITKSLFKGSQLVWLIITIIEGLLFLRLFLKLVGANPQADFTRLVYSLSAVFTSPFQTVFPNTVVQGNTFEWTTLLAMVVYYLIGLVIIHLFVIGKPVTTTEARMRLDE